MTTLHGSRRRQSCRPPQLHHLQPPSCSEHHHHPWTMLSTTAAAAPSSPSSPIISPEKKETHQSRQPRSTPPHLFVHAGNSIATPPLYLQRASSDAISVSLFSDHVRTISAAASTSNLHQ
ncbi:hypothetical protein DEO72_LG10g1693 [Vigna unguiculata]|uniref:Uncharacterized protein n=1 Tax=Vigna unguiculata TaxID=3917 RepID=A0A4D6N9F4_VIGUN|nr:hypothetical protein DEO72_LG10g1693 [Vigna unguiculata]